MCLSAALREYIFCICLSGKVSYCCFLSILSIVQRQQSHGSWPKAQNWCTHKEYDNLLLTLWIWEQNWKLENSWTHLHLEFVSVLLKVWCSWCNWSFHVIFSGANKSSMQSTFWWLERKIWTHRTQLQGTDRRYSGGRFIWNTSCSYYYHNTCRFQFKFLQKENKQI